MADIASVARQYAEWDPNSMSKAELLDKLDAGDDEISKRFTSRLQFGTAGLRGPMGIGLDRMNAVTVLQASQVCDSCFFMQHGG